MGWLSSPKAPKAPDMTAQNALAAQQVNISNESLNWAKQIYAETAPERKEATSRAIEVSNAQMEAMRKQSALTDEYAAYQKETFQPLEKAIVAEAQAYDTPERREAKAVAASADVDMQVANQRAATQREMGRNGVNPSSGKMIAMQGVMDLGAAKLRVGAANTARDKVETIGAAKMADAANLGRGLSSSQATSAGIALNQGNSSVNNGQLPGVIAGQGNAIMTGGFSGAQSGLGQAGNTYGNITQAQLQHQQQIAQSGGNSSLFGALGSVAGQWAGSASGSKAITSGLMALSDVNVKTDITPTDPDEALEAIEKTPVSNWQYKDGSAADDGGQPHTGPMAQDVKKTMGPKVAPGGKKIDLVAMNGIAMSAIQGLSRKVDKLMAAQGVSA